MTNCWHCKKPLWFHDKWTSKQGKLIPLDKDSTGFYHKHSCKNNPHNRVTRKEYRKRVFNSQGPRVIGGFTN